MAAYPRRTQVSVNDMNHLSIFSSGKMVPSVFASLVAVLFLSIPGAFAQSPSTSLLIVTRDASDKPVVGAVVDVKRNGTSVTSGVTNEKGEAHFTDLPPGNYQVVISKDGFQEDTEDNVQLTGTRPEQVLIGLSPKVHIDEAVNVHAQPDQAVDPGATPLGNQLQPSTLNATPTKPATVSDALPLVPGVVRTPEGQLKISGSDENRSALIVNAVDATDPATGQFGVTVPVDSVETVNVFQTPYLAEFGRFTAGVVSVETKRGGDKWNYELNDPLPDFRIFSGHLRGIRDATPRLVFNGPLIKDKLYFSEGLEYELDKTPIKSLAFPFNETKRESVNSFTQFDYIVSQTQTLTGTFHLAPWHANHLNLDFFNPQPVTPAFSAKDYTGAVTDNLTIGATSLLQSTLGVKHFTGDVWAQGPLDMTLSPLGNSG
ncbi:MAG TPA: carboxypeptidase regulatory-like domain-containing protein, partial [Blastocatellia bacterium]|nr:carboxypeptidase regulatory-like domain-containing protein [Blastocatellia bacterium]